MSIGVLSVSVMFASSSISSLGTALVTAFLNVSSVFTAASALNVENSRTFSVTMPLVLL